MFLGQFQHNVDEKGRLTIPVRFREQILSEGAYVMEGFDQNLMVLPSSTFDRLSDGVLKMNLTEQTSRLLRRLIFSTASQVEVDKAGRILLPPFLRQFANLENNVTMVGAGDHFEIWSSALWEEQAELLSDAQSNAQRFEALKLFSS